MLNKAGLMPIKDFTFYHYSWYNLKSLSIGVYGQDTDNGFAIQYKKLSSYFINNMIEIVIIKCFEWINTICIAYCD